MGVVDSFRNWANENAALAMIVVVVVVVIAVGILILTRGRSVTSVGDQWYYDPVEQEYFQGDGGETPPIKSRWGNDSWKAFFYDCGSCKSSTEPENPPGFLAYYMTFDPEIKQKIVELKEQTKNASGAEAAQRAGPAQAELMSLTIKGQKFSRDGQEWVPPDPGRTGQPPFLDEIRRRCEEEGGQGTSLVYCEP